MKQNVKWLILKDESGQIYVTNSKGEKHVLNNTAEAVNTLQLISCHIYDILKNLVDGRTCTASVELNF